jgi:hypothetical protein
MSVLYVRRVEVLFERFGLPVAGGTGREFPRMSLLTTIDEVGLGQSTETRKWNEIAARRRLGDFDCDMGREDRADEIVEKTLGPIYNSHVTKGGITSWGWLRHYVGGKWRRVATTTATDVKTLLAARNAIFAEVNEKAKAASDEINSICGSHQDYIWDIEHEMP